ncbi:CDP-alcohol phosphatidyltransferase family protein [Streptomyces sp. B3I8]|uniref:CDP-alcohol phosphatidyltransferase family protein n=2 Tax=unclassified Streptomyces TaxID=2593676 RepID=UPI00277DC33F|nr:CDP-alcohol phosphatidyltransferase family protein [Streptomyces sp. B3I8]MDQ0789893.1 phosphatidylglycerophosphate synthase [Streptomyces sp. B3I8]
MPSKHRDVPDLAEVRRLVQKKRDAWWTVLLVDPVATPLVRLVAKRTRITPNQITWGALLLGLVAAGCFWQGDWQWLIIGAVVYHVSFILDCMDGKVARLTGQGSVFGAWLDYIFDRVRVMACAVALMAGQYHRTDDTLYIWLAAVVIFLDGLRYLNSLEIFKTRHSMRKQIKARLRAARRAENASQVAFMEDLLRDNPSADIEQDLRRAAEEGTRALTAEDGGLLSEAQGAALLAEAEVREGGPTTATGTSVPAADAGQDTVGAHIPAPRAAEGAEAPGAEGAGTGDGAATAEGAAESTGGKGLPRNARVIDLHQEFRHRFPAYLRFRSFLLRHRIRTHLISGIEFQMGVFIVGPLINAVIPTTIVAGALLLVFELAIVYKLLLSTRDFARTIDSFDREAAARAAAAAEEAAALGVTVPGEGSADATAQGAATQGV